MDVIPHTNSKIAMLFKAASLLPQGNGNKTHEKLKSYYMMRCKELSKGYGLPQKHFSEKVICTHCCLKWSNGTEIKVQPIKLSKRQRRRIRSQKKLSTKINKEELLHSNELEQICGFCKHSTKTLVPKPNKVIVMKSQQPIEEEIVKQKKKKIKVQSNKTIESSSLYNHAAQVFSLKNKKNTLKSEKLKKEKPKIIKNNKKKKDKFAGLCQKAVLASAKLKEENKTPNKLSLFLKPST